MFEVVHFRHKWRSNSEVESELIRNGQQIATAVVNDKHGTIQVLTGGFDSIPENPRLLEHFHKTHTQHWLDVWTKHASDWANRNRNDI